MGCSERMKTIYHSGPMLSPLVTAYNILVGILNITGNAILIWALRRTGQTKTISFQFIAIMSVTDLAAGTTSIVFITLLISIEDYQKYCWLMLVTLVVLNTLNYFSGLMVFLIALDRYLHMKYLERYSIKFTKKRGYLFVIISFVVALSTSIYFSLPLFHLVYNIFKWLLLSMATLCMISVLLLYHRALQILRRKAHQITRSIINQNRALGKAAKRVSICLLVLALPIVLCQLIDVINNQLAIIDSSALGLLYWIAYITLLANGFCSSIIFILQNIRIQRLLKSVVMSYWNRIRPVVRSTADNV